MNLVMWMNVMKGVIMHSVSDLPVDSTYTMQTCIAVPDSQEMRYLVCSSVWSHFHLVRIENRASMHALGGVCLGIPDGYHFIRWETLGANDLSSDDSQDLVGRDYLALRISILESVLRRGRSMILSRKGR